MQTLHGLLMYKMSSTATKSSLSPSRILLVSTVVFIFLSGSQAKEPRKCYWCGPLAEQVHRSQRAPPCDNSMLWQHVTNCDPGFTHCAVAATSPPLVESRYCVKFYHDECHALFCNSTKTWHMTCPCRGDLCNGRKTRRVEDAFTILERLVSQTNNVRIKRTIISSPTAETSSNVTDAVMDNVTDVIQPDQPSNENTKDVMKNITEVKMNEENEIIEEIKATENIKKDTDASNEMKEVTKSMETVKDVIENSLEMHSTTLESKVSNMAEIKVNTEMTTKGMKEMPKEAPTVQNPIKITEKLPAAEALQQNTSPTDKVQEQMTTETTLMTTSDIPKAMTAVPTSSKNNTGTTLHKYLPTLFVGVILNHYL